MLNGGYKIIDFQDNNLTTETPVVITGIYDSLENNNRKAIMVSGITIDGVHKNDCFVDCSVDNSSYTFTAYGKTFTITNEDSVSIA